MGHLRPVPSARSSASFATRIATASRLSLAGLWSILTADRHNDAALCAQPAHRAHRKGHAGSHIPRRWFRDRPHFSGQYKNSYSIISYTTTDSDHSDYTLLSAHPLFRPLCPLPGNTKGNDDENYVNTLRLPSVEVRL
jgi:hypothetical protein